MWTSFRSVFSSEMDFASAEISMGDFDSGSAPYLYFIGETKNFAGKGPVTGNYAKDSAFVMKLTTAENTLYETETCGSFTLVFTADTISSIYSRTSDSSKI
jgi:hypothetical protein